MMDRQGAVAPLKMTLCQTNASMWDIVMTALHPSVRPINQSIVEMFRLIMNTYRIEIHQLKNRADKF
jgi:hypothetical protein